jgi:cell division protein FtsB
MKLKDTTLKLTELLKEEARLKQHLEETDKRNQALSRDNRTLKQNF